MIDGADHWLEDRRGRDEEGTAELAAKTGWVRPRERPPQAYWPPRTGCYGNK